MLKADHAAPVDLETLPLPLIPADDPGDPWKDPEVLHAPMIHGIHGYKGISLAALYSPQFAALHPRIASQLPKDPRRFLAECERSA